MNHGQRDVMQDDRDPIQTATSPVRRKFVRVLEVRDNGLVRFEFAVGWPDLACELVLPRPAFDEFCQRNEVEFHTDAPAPGINTLPAPEALEP